MNLKTVHSYLIILLCITLPMKSSIPEETKKNTEFTELAKKNFNKKHLIPCFMILLHAISILCLKKYLEKEKKESEVDAMIEIKNLKINIAKDIVHIFFFYSYLYSLGLYLDLKLSNHNTIQITLSLYLITITIYILRKIYIHSKNSNQKNIQDSKEFINKYKKNHEQILIILTKLCKFYNENIEKLLENNKNITIKKNELKNITEKQENFDDDDIKQMKEIYDNCDKFKKENKILKQELENLTTKLNEEIQKIEELENKNNITQEEFKTLDEKNKTLKQENETIKNELNEKKKNTENLKTEINEKNKKIKNLEEENKIIQGNLQAEFKKKKTETLDQENKNLNNLFTQEKNKNNILSLILYNKVSNNCDSCKYLFFENMKRNGWNRWPFCKGPFFKKDKKEKRESGYKPGINNALKEKEEKLPKQNGENKMTVTFLEKIACDIISNLFLYFTPN